MAAETGLESKVSAVLVQVRSIVLMVYRIPFLSLQMERILDSNVAFARKQRGTDGPCSDIPTLLCDRTIFKHSNPKAEHGKTQKSGPKYCSLNTRKENGRLAHQVTTDLDRMRKRHEASEQRVPEVKAKAASSMTENMGLNCRRSESVIGMDG